MESSQDYSFNKAHAACYALIAYRTAWLKANHPCEYMAALISSVMNTKDRVPFYVNACDEMGIDVLPPDVNESATDFAVVEGKIRFGLNAVKNVGDNAARAIVAARKEGGPFATIWDFTERVDPQVVNKRALESLVKCGALDSTGASRMGMLGVLEQALAYGQKLAADRLAGQGSIFDLGFGEPSRRPTWPAGTIQPIAARRVREAGAAAAREGVARPLRLRAPALAVRDQLRRKTDATLAELERRRDGEIVTVGGIVSAVKQVTTKKGEPMVFLQLDDPDRVGGGRRLQLHLRGRARAVRRRPDPRRQGPRRPQAAGRDEADRARGVAVRGGRRAARRALPDRRAPGRRRRDRASWRGS